MTTATAERLVDRLVALPRVHDAEGRMNLSLADIGGELLLVSQFTLAADTRKGLRPSFTGRAAGTRAAGCSSTPSSTRARRCPARSRRAASAQT